MALRLKPVIAERAKEKQFSGVNQYTESLSQNSVKPSARIDTQKELAKIANVSHDTIAKVDPPAHIAIECTTKPIARAESARATNYPTADNVP